MEELLASSFRSIYDKIDHDAVKKEIGEIGFDRFVEDCARLSGATGAVAGIGGAFTLVVGVPASVINNVAQQFRVTLGAIYAQRKSAEAPEFDDFMRVVAESLGVEASMQMGNTALITIANAILARIGAGAAGTLIPLVGAVIGGGLNYSYIKGIGKKLKALNLSKGTTKARKG